MRNLEYKVIITDFAKQQIRQILYHIRYRLKNLEAAESIKQDMKETKMKLSYLAESIKLCEEPELAQFGYRIIFLQRHRYIMLYRVNRNTVYIDGVYHELQNYQEMYQ